PLRSGDGIESCVAQLLFAYDNGGPHPYRYLSIIAIDDDGRVEWLFPAPTASAGSIAAEPGMRRELHEEVTVSDRARVIDVAGLFSDAPLARADVERAAATRGRAARLGLPATGQH